MGSVAVTGSARWLGRVRGRADRDGTVTQTLSLSSRTWAEEQFGTCELGDARRTRRLVTVAAQMAARPDESTPDQSESWADCQAAYRLFDSDDVTHAAILEPHFRATRVAGAPGDVQLMICDTTEIDFGGRRKIRGAGPTGSGGGKGFFLHTALMLDARRGEILGLAGQRLFYRTPTPKTMSKSVRRKRGSAEAQVWRHLLAELGTPPAGVRWIHVCDRGADDYEVFLQALLTHTSVIIRAAKLHRKIIAADGRKRALSDVLAELPAVGTRTVDVRATPKLPARTALVALRFVRIGLPQPRVKTAWMRQHAPAEPLSLAVVELREENPPPGVEPVRWVLFTFEPVTTAVEAEEVIAHYEQRPLIEEYHKAIKTGCRLEARRYETATRLERVAAVSAVVAVRLLQLKTAAHRTPHRPARDFAPAGWIKLLALARKKPLDPDITIRDFLRQLAGLGGHLGRKCDGPPGWITLWRGAEKLHILTRGAQLYARSGCV